MLLSTAGSQVFLLAYSRRSFFLEVPPFPYAVIAGHLGCFHIFSVTLLSNAAVNVEVQTSLWDPDFNAFG